MATYNGEKYVLEQVNSILKQLSENDELIISDDSSQDSTVQIIESIGDHRIKLFPKQVYKNPIFNFENALRNSSGDIIFLSDQDDIWMPNKIKIMTPIIMQHHLALSDCALIDEHGDITELSYFSMINSKPGRWRNLLNTNPYVGCCMGFSRQLLNLALPFPKKIPMHDFWLGMIGEFYFRPIFVPQPLTYYRRHDNNASITGVKSTNSLIKKIGFRLQVILPLILRKIKMDRRWKI
ncbi:MAG: glycosyltransferase family 2 protein [Cyclobacteriaceae bacterium]